MIDIARGIALALGGATFGLALAEAAVYWQRYKDPEDAWYRHARLTAVIWIRVGIALSITIGTAVVATRLGDETLTWRTPALIIACLVLIRGMSGTLKDEVNRSDDPVIVPLRRRRTDKIG